MEVYVKSRALTTGMAVNWMYIYLYIIYVLCDKFSISRSSPAFLSSVCTFEYQVCKVWQEKRHCNGHRHAQQLKAEAPEERRSPRPFLCTRFDLQLLCWPTSIKLLFSCCCWLLLIINVFPAAPSE